MPIPAENAKRRPFTRPTEIRRVRRFRQLLGRGDGVARKAERAREHVRAASGDEADGRVGPDPVQHLVEAAVAGEDVHGLGIGMLATSSVA